MFVIENFKLKVLIGLQFKLMMIKIQFSF